MRRTAPGRVLPGLAALGLAAAALTTGATGAAGARIGGAAAPAFDTACSHAGWVSVWSMPTSDDIGPALAAGSTLREIVYPHLGGQRVRVHLSNLFSATPVTLSGVSVGLRAQGAAVAAGSLTALRFGGSATVTIPPGGSVTSDPASFAFPALHDLTVSVSLAAAAPTPAEHLTAEQADYLGPGSRTADPSAAGFARTPQTGDAASPFSSETIVSGVDGYEPVTQGAVVALGDSLTDGLLVHGADTDARWPDVLARRLAASGVPLSVVNAGISGNRVTEDVTGSPYGSSAAERFDRDVLGQAGVRTVILFEGINDIHAGVEASAIEAADAGLLARAHAAGLRALLATLTPSGVAGDDGVDTEATQQRLELNTWIRSQRLADGVLDFDTAAADPLVPTRLATAFDGGDHLHLSPAGNVRLADAIPLGLLLPPGCLPTGG